MGVHDSPSKNFVRANTTVVATLRGREAVVGPTERGKTLEEGVFLFKAEPGVEVAVLLGRRGTLCSGVARVRRQVGKKRFAHHELVVAAANRVWNNQDRVQNNIGLIASRLIC